MTNKIVTANIKPGARIRIGVPNEDPIEVINTLHAHFLSRPSVLSTRLGLMEVLNDDNAEGFFTYTIGIACNVEAHTNAEVDAAMRAISATPTGRWPISFFPPTATYFTAESRVFYQIPKASKPGLVARISEYVQKLGSPHARPRK